MPLSAPAAKRLVLASSSPFRRACLDKLGLAYSVDAPAIDEARHAGEPPATLVVRLAREKAEAVGARHPDALVIGSDQVAVIDGRVLGKPGGHAAAVEQLSQASGRRVSFLNGLCLLNTAAGRSQTHCEPFHVDFRRLGRDEIEGYLRREQPYGCAGSFKSEGLGIVLFERLVGDDPNALIGLPLIRLAAMLRNEGVSILD